MDKPVPNNPHLHDWLGAGEVGPKPIDPMAFDPKLVLETLSAGAGPMKAMAMQQMELVTLASRRAQAYLGVPQRLSRCRTRQDLVDEQMRFWQTAMAQYQDSATRIYRAWSDLFALGALPASRSIGFPAKPAEKRPDAITVPGNGLAKTGAAPVRIVRPRRDPV